ncbi:hypothetical protein [Algoriphagus sp. A40]|uniref:hypothetical protein n=1 Tax=Algoriphagus sp. A40 TaxID=1945863 RepID=UPI0009877766|nr:hypothetical protein [Algoriphagus sp. A40]OOG76472.1 hypothetical protein B0E43_08275 [Algoriphagus sp. A40]
MNLGMDGIAFIDRIIIQFRPLKIVSKTNLKAGFTDNSDEISLAHFCKTIPESVPALQNLRNRTMIPYSCLGGVIYYHQEEVKKLLLKQGSTENPFGKI